MSQALQFLYVLQCLSAIMFLDLLNYGLDLMSFVVVITALNDKKGTKVTSFHNRRT